MILPPDQCVAAFLSEAHRLGIEVRWQTSKMHQLDAAYQARPGAPGLIVLHDRKPRPSIKQQCVLLTHEMVHVLQHWKGHLKSVPPLGWPINNAPKGRDLSEQEQEAYTAQSKPKIVLDAVKLLKPASIQISP